MTRTRISLRPALLAALALLLLAGVLLAACSDGEDPASATASTPTPTVAPASTATPAASPDAETPTATATSAPTATPSPTEAAGSEPFSEPDAERAFEHLRVLAEEIGSRSAGTAAERAAAAYIAAQFEAAGYAVAIEEFEARFNSDTSTLTVEGEGPPISAFAMSGGPQAEASAALVFAGLGAPDDFLEVGAAGSVVLLDRGLLTFANKARNAEAAGAVAVVVVNNEPGAFRGALGDNPGISIPVLAVAGELGPALRALAEDAARVTVRSEFGTRFQTSQNVVGRPAGGGECSAYLGAHYDSVTQGRAPTTTPPAPRC